MTPPLQVAPWVLDLRCGHATAWVGRMFTGAGADHRGGHQCDRTAQFAHPSVTGAVDAARAADWHVVDHSALEGPHRRTGTRCPKHANSVDAFDEEFYP